MKPRIYALLAHHDPESFNGQLFSAVTDACEKAAFDVDKLLLYERAQEIPFYTPQKLTKPLGNLQELSSSAFFQENKERFMAADYLFIVYPIYWYSTPGILKSWLDLITNFAWKYESGPYAKPLHKIKGVFVVQTSFQSWWRRYFIDGNLEARQLRKSFDFMGIRRYTFYDRGSIHQITDEQKEKETRTVIDRALRFFKQ